MSPPTNADINTRPITERWDLTIDGTDVSLAVTHRGGPSSPVLFLHGFGSSKEDYADFLLKPAFKSHAYLAFDFPGCGKSSCSDPSRLTISFLVKVAEAALQNLSISRFHLVGHSMGALTALQLACKHPERVRSFTNIKGNLAPEDCFLSRQIVDYPATDDEVFFEAFAKRTAEASYYSSAMYASTLRLKCSVESVRPIFTSMVELSDTGELLGNFLALPFPRMFMFGEQYNSLSYLPNLAAGGVELAEIVDSGHFPMYSNPPAMWRHIEKALVSGESQ